MIYFTGFGKKKIQKTKRAFPGSSGPVTAFFIPRRLVTYPGINVK